jgi:hypothetical protein
VTWFVLATAGCTASLEAYPPRPYDTAVPPAPPSTANSVQVVQQFYALPTEPQRRTFRDELIAERIALINISYRLFEARLFQEGTEREISTDWALLGLAAAGATVSSSATQSILAAISGGLVGARAAFDKQALFDRTLPALVSQMESSRLRVELRLLQGMQQDTGAYGIVQALGDLDAYYAAGTLPGAIINVAGDAGITKARIEQERTFSFTSYDEAAKSLQQLLTGPSGTLDQAKLRVMRSCFPVAGVASNVLNTDFLYGPEFAVERTRVLACMRGGAAPVAGPISLRPDTGGQRVETTPVVPPPRPPAPPPGPDATMQELKLLLQDPDTHALIPKQRELAISCYPQALDRTFPLSRVLLEPDLQRERTAIIACMHKQPG